MNTGKTLLIPLFIATAISMHAQNHAIDSLKQVLKSEKDDSNKVKTLYLLSHVFCKQSIKDSCLKYGNESFALAEKTGYGKCEGNTLLIMGSSCVDLDDDINALNYFTQGLAVFRKTGDKIGIARSHGNIGLIFEKQGNYPKALDSYLGALNTFIELKDSGGMVACNNNIGNVYVRLENFPKAVEYYQQGLSISKATGDKEGEADCLQNIANIYHHRAAYSKSIDFFMQALNLGREIGDKAGEANVLGDIASVYNDMKEFDKAVEFAKKALALTRQIGDESDYGFDLQTMGYINLYQKKYKDSKIYFDSALMVSKKTGDKEYVKDIYFNLANIDSADGDYKTAWLDYKNYISYRDSLVNEATIKKTTQAEMNYTFTRKTDSAQAVQDKLNAISEKESQRQKVIKNSFIGGFSIMFLASGVFFFQRRRISKEKKRSDELLLNILPEETAEELKATGTAKAKSFDMVTVMFTDFKDFTKIAEKLTPEDLVAELHTIFQAFDNIIHKHNIEKIKTIGDSYMAAGGLPLPNQTHAKDVVTAALEIQQFMLRHNDQRTTENKPVFQARIGINTGPVVAGIVGIKKFAYDIWGDTVNLASRVESNGEVGKVNISGTTYELVKNDFEFTHRGKIHAKNKGEVDMYFVERRVITEYEI